MLLLLSRAARRRKSFQERTRYKTLYILLLLDVNVRSSGQNFFSVNFPSSLFVCGPFFLRSSSLLLCLLLFFFRPSRRRRHKSLFTPRTEREKDNLYTSKTMMMHSCSARTPPTVVVENTKVRYCFFVVSNSLFALSLSSFTSSSSLASTRSLFCLGEILFG